MLGHKTSFNKLKIEIIPVIFSNQNEMKLEINSKRKTGKCINMWKLNTTFLNNQLVKEITRENRKYLEINLKECNISRLMDSVKVLRRIFIAVNAYIKKRKI